MLSYNSEVTTHALGVLSSYDKRIVFGFKRQYRRFKRFGSSKKWISIALDNGRET